MAAFSGMINNLKSFQWFLLYIHLF